jgi:hypothetical protein
MGNERNEENILCLKLHDISQQLSKWDVAELDKALQTLADLKALATEDDHELKGVLSAGRKHAHAVQAKLREAEEGAKQGLPGETPIDVTDIMQFGTYSDWVVAYGEYFEKYCYNSQDNI